MSDIKNKLLIPVDLNEGQKEAYKNIISFLTLPGDSIFLLEGFGGTGKTFIVGKIVRHILKKHPGWAIALTAPTNKAVKVLQRSSSMKDKNVSFQTIHKLLGLKEQITNDGQQIFVRQKEEDMTITDYNFVIVDEVSMLNDELFHELRKHSRDVKILFMGDPAQIPPVGKIDCIPFIPDERSKYNITTCSLTEIMRQAAGNPIIETSFEIRNNLDSRSPIDNVQTKLNDNDLGVIRIDANNKDERDKLNTLFADKFDCPEFVANPDYAKIIAWRNVTVNNLNKIIRSIIYKRTDLPKLMPGEKLIANKPIVADYDTILFSTNDEFEVVKYEVKTCTYATSAEAIKLQIYETKVKYIDIQGREVTKTIEILHEDSEVDFNKYVLMLKNDAIKTKGANRAWPKYYNFLRKFADVIYGYSISAHKCVSVESLVLTEAGFVRIGDIKVGDIIESNNKWSVVKNVWPTVKIGYTIRTKSGRSIIASAEHRFPMLLTDDTFKMTGVLRSTSELVIGNDLIVPKNVDFTSVVNVEDYTHLRPVPEVFGFENNNYLSDTIVSITEGSEVDMVDIEIDDPEHIFFCNGFLTHNSQGSTYNNVFVIEDDINYNSNTVEKNRILYTAYSRASERLYIIKR